MTQYTLGGVPLAKGGGWQLPLKIPSKNVQLILARNRQLKLEGKTKWCREITASPPPPPDFHPIDF